jgi:hypothetical protein
MLLSIAFDQSVKSERTLAEVAEMALENSGSYGVSEENGDQKYPR